MKIYRNQGPLEAFAFSHLFGHLVDSSPRYGNGDGRELTADERQMLAESTERLIAKFEAEQRASLEQARLHQEQQAQVEQTARERVERQREEAERRRTQAAEDLAGFEREAKAIVRQKYSVDPDAPGWRGLVLVEVRRSLGR